MVEHGAPRGLGRMRGEHELDVQRAQRLGGVDARPREQLRGLRQRLALLVAGGVVLAPAPDPLALLGDVGELQLQRAGADVGLDLLVAEALQATPSAPRARCSSPPRSSPAVRWIQVTRSANSRPCCSVSDGLERTRQEVGLARDRRGGGGHADDCHSTRLRSACCGNSLRQSRGAGAMGWMRAAGAVAVLAAVWAAPAAAQAPSYGGGRLPSAAVPERGYVPTLGIVLQPRGDRIALRFDTSLRCGGHQLRHRRPRGRPVRRPQLQRRRRPPPPDRRAAGSSFAWTLAGQADGTIASGTLRITGTRTVNGRRTACNRKPTRRFTARLAGPAPRARRRRRPRASFGGLSAIRVADGLRGPVDPQGHRQRPQDRGALDRARLLPQGPAGGPRELHAVDADPPGRRASAAPSASASPTPTRSCATASASPGASRARARRAGCGCARGSSTGAADGS